MLCYHSSLVNPKAAIEMHLQIQSSSPPLLVPISAKPHRLSRRFRLKSRFPKCSLSLSAAPKSRRPLPAEVSRTIVALGSVGALSTLTGEGWPLGIGVRFTVDAQGTPVLCLTDKFSPETRSSLHVQLAQSGLRTPQCTILGNIVKPEDANIVRNLSSIWKKRFGEEVDENLIHIVSVERVLQMEDFEEPGSWISSSDYRSAQPDPLRDSAERLVDEINTDHMEDINRFCNVYLDLNFPVSEAKVIWMDRLGFDMRVWSPQSGIVEVRIPFPAEVSDEKGAKSSFNCMSQLAWEVEKNFRALDFEKVKEVKQIAV